MAITVTSNLTLVSNCDATTGWSGGERFEADTGVKIQGNACLADWINNTTSPLSTYALSASVDMSTATGSGEHIYVWMYCSGVVDTQANGGFRVYAESTTGNNATWYVGGNDTHAAGWTLFVVNPNDTPDASNGTFAPNNINTVGIQFKTITAAVKKGQTYIMNCFWDIMRYGTGLTITSGATDAITLEDIFAEDSSSTNMYGVVQKSYGSYIISGKLIFGNTGTGSVDFNMLDEVMIYPVHEYVSSTFNTIEVLGNTTGTSNFEVAGSFIKALSDPALLDLTGSNLNTISIEGSSIINFSTVDFAASQTITDNVFGTCGQIDPSTSTFTGNTIKDSTETTTGALYLPSTSGVDNITFSNNTYDVFIDAAATFTDISFDHTTTGTADIYYTQTGDATFNVPSDGNTLTVTNSSTGTLTVVAGQVTTKVIVKHSDGTLLTTQDANVLVEATVGGDLTVGTDIIKGFTNTSGEVTDVRSFTSDQPIAGRVRKGSVTPFYKTFNFTGTISSSTGFTITCTLIDDE